MIPEIDIILRLVTAVVLGGVVGFERQKRHKSAGLRTHILVSLGACLTMIVSINVSLSLFFTYKLTNTDAERIAAQVVSGIGFLGAGTILANRKGLIVGLTTAASLWVVAAIGLATGAGFWISAIVTTSLVYLTLTVMSRLETHLKCSTTACQYDFIITTIALPGQIGKIGEYFGNAGINIRELHTEIVSEDEDNRYLDIFVSVEAPNNITAPQIISGLLTVEGIIGVKKD